MPPVADLPPQLIVPDHYVGNRPAIIRPLPDDVVAARRLRVQQTVDGVMRSFIPYVCGPMMSGRRRGGGLVGEVTIPGSAVGGSGSGSVNFASVGFGDAPTGANTRHLIACIGGGNSSTDNSPSGATTCTIGGVSATQLIFLAGDDADETDKGDPEDEVTGMASLWIAAVPTGTSGTVNISLVSSASLSMSCRVLRAMNLSSATPTSSSSVSATMNVPANGFGVLVAVEYSSASNVGTPPEFSGSDVIAIQSGGGYRQSYRTVSGNQAHTSSGANAVGHAAWTFV